jgi:hypothetical protein
VQVIEARHPSRVIRTSKLEDESGMNESRTDRATGLWIARKPWRLKAFRRSAPAAQTTPTATNWICDEGAAAVGLGCTLRSP